MTRAAWGSIVGEVRGMLAERGAVSTWEVRQIRGADPSNATRALVKSGEAVSIRGSTLYARPDVAAKIEAVIEEASRKGASA